MNFWTGFFVGWISALAISLPFMVLAYYMAKRDECHEWDIPSNGSAHLDRICPTCGHTESFR